MKNCFDTFLGGWVRSDNETGRGIIELSQLNFNCNCQLELSLAIKWMGMWQFVCQHFFRRLFLLLIFWLVRSPCKIFEPYNKVWTTDPIPNSWIEWTKQSPFLRPCIFQIDLNAHVFGKAPVNFNCKILVFQLDVIPGASWPL